MPMNSRETILSKLRSTPKPFPNVVAPTVYLPMSPLAGTERAALKARFIREAELLSCRVYEPQSDDEAAQIVLDILSDDEQVVAWDMEQIPFRPLAATLYDRGITAVVPGDPSVRVGITGADAALAATGSVVLSSGFGQYRGPSLLSAVHVVFITQDLILPHMESWLSLQRQDNLESFRESSNIVVISGPSRTADIAMELILGMHGPRAVHIIILSE